MDVSGDQNRPWFAIASDGRVVRRALRYGLVVGTVLVAINHGSELVRGEVPLARMLRMALTVLVPYVVSTLTSIEADRAADPGPEVRGGNR